MESPHKKLAYHLIGLAEAVLVPSHSGQRLKSGDEPDFKHNDIISGSAATHLLPQLLSSLIRTLCRSLTMNNLQDFATRTIHDFRFFFLYLQVAHLAALFSIVRQYI